MADEKKVGLDAGHGGYDGGAYYNGVKEKDINLEVTLQVGDILKRHGVIVYYTRISDVFVDLSERCRILNELFVDYMVSIHHNAGGGDGAETIHSIYGGLGKELAEKIMEEFIAIGQNKRAVYSRTGNNGDYYGVIRESNMPCVISEYGFMDTIDMQIFDTPEERTVEAIAIAKGILRQLEIAYIEPTNPSTTIYRVQVGAFISKFNADAYLKRLQETGFDGFLILVNGMWKVQVGAFAIRDNALAYAEKVKQAGFITYIVRK